MKHHDQNMNHYCLTPRGMHHKWFEPLGCILSDFHSVLYHVCPSTDTQQNPTSDSCRKRCIHQATQIPWSWAHNCCMTNKSQKLHWFYQGQHNSTKETWQPNRWAMIRMTHLLSEETMILEWAAYLGNWTGINGHTRWLLNLPFPDTTNWY